MNKKLVLVTGMSGAGKSTAMSVMEDMGYRCIDQLPIQLLSDFLQLIQTTEKDTGKLRRYLSERGKILPRRTTGTCAAHQRALTSAIKRARQIARNGNPFQNCCLGNPMDSGS